MYIPKNNDENGIEEFVFTEGVNLNIKINNVEDVFKHKDLFGFFNCAIIASEGLKHPILQTHFKIKVGIRIIAPLSNIRRYFI